ncbi:hypothetical protein [Sedimentitalea sp.]|uniref:hypothetical protein n=1 Tax=Sedimentitalea sp. TaxID=2048915 RepID=UPI003297181B
MEFLRGIFSSLNEYLNLGLDLTLPFFPTFTVIGWLIGTSILVLRYITQRDSQPVAEGIGDQATYSGRKWPPRLVLMYDIITMTFLAIGVGISITILERVNHQAAPDCGQWTCQDLMEGVASLRREIVVLENSLDEQAERNSLLQGRLEDIATRQSADWMTSAAERILERRDDDTMTGPVASNVIREEFFQYFDVQ